MAVLGLNCSLHLVEKKCPCCISFFCMKGCKYPTVPRESPSDDFHARRRCFRPLLQSLQRNNSFMDKNACLQGSHTHTRDPNSVSSQVEVVMDDKTLKWKQQCLFLAEERKRQREVRRRGLECFVRAAAQLLQWTHLFSI